MDIGLDIGAAAYAVGYIATWRRYFWRYCEAWTGTLDGSDVAWFGSGAALMAAAWPVTLPIWRLSSDEGVGWRDIANRVGKPPKHIREQQKVKTLEARNKELERQLDL